MAISLYEASVAGYLQTLDAVAGFMDRALSHFRDEGVDPQAVVEARLHPDMLPFRFQVRSVAHHSAGAVEAIRNGSFGPPGEGPAYDYAGLQALVDKARTGLRALAPEDIDRREGAEVVFRVRDFERVFTAEGFVLSFSVPNFHFHAATAYDILRSHGAPLGKRDYMGALRLKG